MEPLLGPNMVPSVRGNNAHLPVSLRTQKNSCRRTGEGSTWHDGYAKKIRWEKMHREDFNKLKDGEVRGRHMCGPRLKSGLSML